MILAALALALQAPAFLRDPDFVSAYTEWIRCTHRVMDAADRSGRRDEEIVATAYAGCAAEEAAVRATIAVVSGEAAGARDMNDLLATDRPILLERARRRRAAAEMDALSRAWGNCVARGIEAAAAETPEGRAVDAALDGCAAEQEALRRWAGAQVSASRANLIVREGRSAYRQRALEHLRQRRGQPAPPGD